MFLVAVVVVVAVVAVIIIIIIIVFSIILILCSASTSHVGVGFKWMLNEMNSVAVLFLALCFLLRLGRVKHCRADSIQSTNEEETQALPANQSLPQVCLKNSESPSHWLCHLASPSSLSPLSS